MSADPLELLPPQDLRSEAAVLCSIFLDPGALLVVEPIVQPADFYKAANKRIYSAILDLRAAGVVPEKEAVERQLAASGDLDAVGGPDYLEEIARDGAPSAANAEYYARRVRDTAQLRQLIEAARAITRDAYAGDGTTDQILDRAEATLVKALERRGEGTSCMVGPIARAELSRAEEGRPVPSLRSHLATLDAITGGFAAGGLTLVAARPSVGKSSFALGVVRDLVVYERVPCLFASLEMTRSELAQNLVAQIARIDSTHIRDGRLTAQELAAFRGAAAQLDDAPLEIDDAERVSIATLRARARYARLRHGIQLLVVDYLGLMAGADDRREENRVQEISAISRGLKCLAKELKIPVIALAQLNRQVEGRGLDAKPRLSDLRDSGSLEQDADLVIMLWRKPVNGGTDLDANGLAIVNKNRHGPTGACPFFFVKEHMRFEAVSSATAPAGYESDGRYP